MPQLAKGGKHVFGWSIVGPAGEVTVPPAALAEYGLTEGRPAMLIPGSSTSGGFSIVPLESLADSPLGEVLRARPELAAPDLADGTEAVHRGRLHCRVTLRDGCIAPGAVALARYGATPGDRLLVVRGSGLGVGFAVRGPLVTEAERHLELEVFAAR